jgi:NADPH2:quinone reductase
VRALQVVELSGPAGLVVAERPEPAAGDAPLVEVRAVGLCYVDLLRSRGQYQQQSELPFVLGQQFAGVVAHAPASSRFAVGDEVAGMTPADGAGAELVVADDDWLIPLGSGMSFAQGAASLLNYETAVVALEERGRLREGETVLVHGAAGGTGTAAIQIAKAGGAHVLAVVSTSDKAAVAREAGADHAILTDQPWREAVMDHTNGLGVDVVFDPVGGDRMLDTLRVLRQNGRWIVIGFTGGEIPQIPANRLLLRNIDAVGSNVGGYFAADPQARTRIRRRLSALREDGLASPLVGATYRAHEAQAALGALEARQARGQIAIAFD